MERSECVLESLGTRLSELMRFAPYLVATIYSKRPPCLNFAVYIVSIRSYMLPRRLRRLNVLLVEPITLCLVYIGVVLEPVQVWNSTAV